MQSAGWQRLLHTQPCPSSHAEGTGPAHYLKILMNRMIISKMATKINSMINKMVTKANRPLMNIMILMIQINGDHYGSVLFRFCNRILLFLALMRM